MLRIVPARDGGICRIKLPGGVLSAAQARAIADASTRHANGVAELTNRANLQLRGVRNGHEAALSAALIGAGLGPAGALSSADDVRNVMISPAAGRDPHALIDTTPLCGELLTLLQGDARLVALSPKFALLLDGGEQFARVDHPHDVWLAASADEEGVRFVFGLAGCPAPAGENSNPRDHHDSNGTGALAAVPASRVPALLRALLHTFLDLAPADTTRMRDLLATHCADALLRHAQRYVDFPLARDASLSHWQRHIAADPSLRLGAHAQRGDGTSHVGGQPPLGRIDAATLRALAALAQKHGNGRLHATPWQSVLLPDIATTAVPAVLAKLIALGLACDPAQAITHVIACTGSAGCAKGLADTKTDALQLAERLPAGVDVHLTGCPRSCAAAHRAPYTLLAAAPGLYDLYRRDGRPGFGQCVAPQLTIDEAAALLARLARSTPHA
ncbi:precorrin-3B synthase [Paraburkholderia sp. HC6.4b]|nr:precorrin-3B synthase [Paraburkholderia sp. HC6.4b]MBB5451501.1 precorrin-3B synthase [Paraburkholderia sp. Kb1A]